VQLLRTIDAPRVFHPGADDKSGFWEDFGITTAFDFSKASRSLVATIKDSTGTTRLFVFDLEHGTIRSKETVSTNSHAEIKAVKLSPDGTVAAVPTGEDKDITLWSVATGARIGKNATGGPAGDVDWHPSGGLVAVVAGKNIEIWSASGGVLERQRSIRAARHETEWPMSARWSPDGLYLAIGTNSPAIYIAKADGTSQSPTLSPPPKGSVYVTEWNASGDRLAAAGFGVGGEVSIWKDPRLALESPFERKYELVRTIAPPERQWWGKLTWDPTGRWVVLGDNASNCGIWDASTGTLLKSFVPHPGSAVLEAHWKDDYLITVGAHPDKNFRIWRVTP
jgi:WD40 repeat protein